MSEPQTVGIRPISWGPRAGAAVGLLLILALLDRAPPASAATYDVKGAVEGVLSLAAAVACFRNARAAGRRFQPFWGLLGLASLLWGLANVLAILLPRPTHLAGHLGPQDWLFAASSLAFVVACMTRPARARDLTEGAFDVAILCILALHAWLYFTLPDILAGARVPPDWVVLIEDGRALLMVACAAALAWGAQGPWRRVSVELALALALLFVGDAVWYRALAAGVYHPGFWDLHSLLAFLWIGFVAWEARSLGSDSRSRPDWRELRRTTVVTILVLSFVPVMEYGGYLLFPEITSAESRVTAPLRAALSLAVSVALALLFLLRQLRLIRSAEEQRADQERALRNSESRLRLALEAAGMVTWEWDFGTNQITWSGGPGELPTPAGGSPQGPSSLSDYVHPDDIEELSQRAAAARAGETDDFYSEHRLVGDGREEWVEARGRVERDASRRPVRLRGTLADVTSRRRVEEALRYSEERSRRLSEASFEGLAFSEEGRVIDANRQVADMLGYTVDEMIGRPVMDFVAPEDRDAVMARIMSGQVESYGHRALRRDGSLFPVEIRARMLSHRGMPIRVTAMRDMSERARLEGELERAARDWRECFDALSEGVLLVDDARIVRRMNSAARALLEKPPGRNSHLDELGPGEPWPALSRLLRALEQTGTTEAREVQHSGEGRHWLIGGALLPRESPTPWAILTTRDVTETVELRSQLGRRERLATMGSLVAGVAHEVRTPLFSISAALDAFEPHLADPKERQQFMELMRSQVTRMTQLMTDLLDYGRPADLSLRSGGIEGAIARATRACSSLAEKAGVSVAADIAPSLPPVRHDPARLEQVFQNLMANAIQHSPRGSVVRLSARPSSTADGIECRVEDEGPGVEPADLARLFEPFFSRRGGGTGLGLSIAQRILEEHRGTVRAANRPEGGAVFTVWLPTDGGRPGPSAEPAS